MSLEIKKDQAILVRPFDWRVWLVVFTLTPALALVLFLSDRLYDGHAAWWRVVDFITRCTCIESMVAIPKERNYNRIFSLTGIWGYYILVLFYTGRLVHILVQEAWWHTHMTILTATLVSLLAKPKQPAILASVDELVRQDKIKWIIEAGSAFVNMGEDAEEGSTMR